MMIRLIVSDIDGTLLGHDGVLPPANTAALQAALAGGVRLALATIRKRDSTVPIARQLDLPCSMICEGGATIYDEHGSLLRALTIPLDIAQAIAELADAHAFPLLTTIDEVNYYTGHSRPTHFVAEGVDVASNSAIMTSPPTRLIVRGEAGVNLLMATFADAPLLFVRHYRSDGTLYDAAITHREASKESALGFLCAALDIAPDQVLALGDSESDIGMIQMAGIGVAPGDAHPPVRAAADWVAPRAGDSGLAAAIQRFVL